MPYSDAELRNAVDAVFSQFDKDKSGTLEQSEVFALVNAALSSMKAGRQATQDQVGNLIKAVDRDGDGKIAKPELFEIFKKVANN